MGDVADLDLDPTRRDALVSRLLAALEAVGVGTVTLRGSLATGTAGPTSDIDLSWVVPDESFEASVAAVPMALSAVGKVASLRVDPDLAGSDRRRLLYASFAGMPLFWRVDLDVRAESVASIAGYDDHSPAARSEEGWSRPESALWNALGAAGALAAGEWAEFDGLVDRAFRRIGLERPLGLGPRATVERLIAACAAQDPALGAMAREVGEVLEALVTGPVGGDPRPGAD
jgi:hypothetical protein